MSRGQLDIAVANEKGRSAPAWQPMVDETGGVYTSRHTHACRQSRMSRTWPGISSKGVGGSRRRCGRRSTQSRARASTAYGGDYAAVHVIPAARPVLLVHARRDGRQTGSDDSGEAGVQGPGEGCRGFRPRRWTHSSGWRSGYRQPYATGSGRDIF